MEQAPVKGNAQSALTMATTGFFAGFAGLALFGPLVPRFTDLMHLSPVAAGLLAAIASLTGSILRIPFGALADRGGKRPFLALQGLALIGMVGLIFLLRQDYPNHLAGTYPILLVLGMLVGSGIATFSVGIAQVSYWFPKAKQGGPLGIYAGIGNLGSGIFSLLLPMAVVAFGMVRAYELWFVFLLVVAILYAIFMKDAPSFQLNAQGETVTLDRVQKFGQDTLPAGSACTALMEAAREPATWALVVLYFTSFGGFMALTSWLPTFWHSAYHSAVVAGGALTLIFSVTASLVRVPGGLLADRLSIRFALSVNVVIIVAGTLLMVLAPNQTSALIGALIVALGMGLQNAVVFKLVPWFVPNAVGGAAGWVGGLGAFGGFVLPPIMGAIAGHTHNYADALVVFWVLGVINWAVIVWLTRTAKSKVALAPDFPL